MATKLEKYPNALFEKVDYGENFTSLSKGEVPILGIDDEAKVKTKYSLIKSFDYQNL